MLDRPPAKTSDLTPATVRRRALLDRLTHFGYDRIEPPVLQGASDFLDLGGEEIRASLFFTSDRSGAELCLRPEYTIPVCRAYLASRKAEGRSSFSYCGPVFRFRTDGPGEFIQAGLESFGRDDKPAADAETLWVALEAADAAGSGRLDIRFSDVALLTAVLDALQLPPNWQRRLKRGLDRGETPAEILAAASSDDRHHSGVLSAFAGVDESGARALVNDLLAIAGVATVGGRSADEIAERFLAQVALRGAAPFADEQRAVLDLFLAISGHPDEAVRALRALSDEAGLQLGALLDVFDERTGFMVAHGVDLDAVRFDARFGRHLDYYTGFVFEARNPAGTEGPVIGGGRYDRLAQALGHGESIPAVGAAIWPDLIGLRELPA